MNIKLLALLTIVLVVLEICSFAFVDANFSPGPVQVFISSPNSSGSNTNPILLKISALMFLDPLNSSENRYIAYSVDGQANVAMTPVYQGVINDGGYSFSSVTSQADLPNLPEGWHVIMVYVKYDYGTWKNEGSARVEFAVGRPTAPNPNSPLLKAIIPANSQIFPEKQPIPYFLNISIPPSWFGNNPLDGEIYSVSYVLDNSRNITGIAGADAAKGPHGPIVINGSKPAYIPVYTVNHPYIILTGTIPAQPLGNHTMSFQVLWSDYRDNIMKSNFLTRFSVSDKISQPINTPLPIAQTQIFAVISPKNNETYNTNQVPIIYSVESRIIWSYYSIDGQNKSSDWKSFHGNLTLTGLSEGTHKLIISIKTEANVGSWFPTFEQTIFFDTDNNAPMATNPTLPAPTPTVPEFSWLIILPLFFSIVFFVVLIRRRKYL